MRIHPFHAERPPPDLAARVASVPYDVVDADQARRIAGKNPDSFLHVIRPEVDLPADLSAYDDQVYDQGRRALRAFRTRGLLCRDPNPCVYLYQLSVDGHRQTGLVATSHIDDYEQQVIKRHENTLSRKEDDRTRHIDALDAHTGPVFLAYRDHPAIDRLQQDAVADPPLYDFIADDGVRHIVWRVEAPQPWIEAFAAVPAAYVADGHHRAASAARVCRMRRERLGGADASAPHLWFLTVLFPASQLRILPYQRVIADLNGLSPEAFVDRLRGVAELAPAVGTGPERSGETYVCVGGSWWALRWTPPAGSDPVRRLDVSLLQEQVLAPILGIDHPREDARIRFVGGVGGLDPLAETVRSGDAAAAFALYPTSMRDLMAVADAGLVMPPKSTWFDPKLRSGLFLYSLRG